MKHDNITITAWQRAACVGALALLSAMPGAAAEHPERVLLRTEIAAIVESLKLNEPDFAKAHLAIIEAEFPAETRIIAYYRGVLEFRAGNWQKAIDSFSQLPPREGEDDSDILLYLFQAHLALAHTGLAEQAIRELEKRYGQSVAAVDSRIQLARVIFEEKDGPPRAYALVAGLAAKFPDHPQRTWLLWATAEDQWNVIQRLLKERGETTDALSAELVNKIQAAVSAYEAVQSADAKSDEATAAGFRIKALKTLTGD